MGSPRNCAALTRSSTITGRVALLTGDTFRQRVIALQAGQGPIVEAFLRSTGRRESRELNLPTLVVFELSGSRIHAVTELPGDPAAWRPSGPASNDSLHSNASIDSAAMFVAPNVVRFADTVNVYLLRSAGQAILIDFGSGDVLDHLGEFDVTRVTDVLLTHYHRDVTQGLARAHEAGIRIWAPPTERDLIERVDEHWQACLLDNVYDLREDRFALLEPVPLTGVVDEYRTRRFGAFDVLTLPTPGHTPGSVSHSRRWWTGRRLAFTGDLIAAPGQGLVAGGDPVDLHRN